MYSTVVHKWLFSKKPKTSDFFCSLKEDLRQFNLYLFFIWTKTKCLSVPMKMKSHYKLEEKRHQRSNKLLSELEEEPHDCWSCGIKSLSNMGNKNQISVFWPQAASCNCWDKMDNDSQWMAFIGRSMGSGFYEFYFLGRPLRATTLFCYFR